MREPTWHELRVAIQKKNELTLRPFVSNIPTYRRRKLLSRLKANNAYWMAAGQLNSFIR